MSEPPPPPEYEGRMRTPTTLTMRAIVDDGVGGAGRTPSEQTPAESYDTAFNRGVYAYLRQDDELALSSFEAALRLAPGHWACVKNIRILRERLGIAANGD